MKFPWRGDELAEGKIHTVIEVPSELLDDKLSIYGKRCLNVDFVTTKNVCE